MIYKYKNLIEKIVDIKNTLNLTLLNLLLIVFPLNQQYHFRPFSSVDGVIIDYLILKISLPEILVVTIVLLNTKQIFKDSLNYIFNFWSVIIVFLVANSVLRSSYPLLALYENLMLFFYVLLGFYFYRNLKLLNIKLLSKSIKIWIVLLTILGGFQFYFQSSVLNNYPLTGEFPYTEDHYHIKQKNLFFDNLIPPYGVFSHSNILGGYLIFLIIFLRIIKSDSKIFYLLIILNLILVGSSACILAFIVYLVSQKLNRNQSMLLIKFLFVISFLIYFQFSYQYDSFKSDASIHRRLYMFDLSSSFFLENPLYTLFGSGYYNYFSSIKNDLYRYELVRFFQPPHFSFYLFIWQYGLVLLLILIYLYLSKSNIYSRQFLSISLVSLILFSFDHYLITNHQFKILFLLIIPYSLNYKNSIK